MDSQYFTAQGLEKLKEEYAHRTGQLRQEITARIKEAKEQGDLSENQEYADAKEAQSMNEGRIEELKQILENAVVFSGGPAKTDIVGVGSVVTVQTGKDAREFTIVGASESDPARGFISNESPIGAALIGKKKGECVTVFAPKGQIEYTILGIK